MILQECNTTLVIGLISAASLVASSTAVANPGWEFGTAGTSYSDGTWDFATAFTANANVSVTGLGYYADPINGFVDSNPVALYQCSDAGCDGTGTLLASALVTNLYPLDGHFRYVTISPVNLIAGVSYEVAGVSNSDNYTWNDTGFAVNPNISLIENNGQDGRWQSLGTPDFLNYGQSDLTGADGYWGPNIFIGTATFTEVPEPVSLFLMGIGLAALGVMRRKKSI